jgi:DNA-binding transcriptional regulator YhcF (GntR family)
MIIEIDTASATPPFEQIRDQVATMAANGVLPVGTRLPTIRQLASDLGLAPGTVARAYRELETDGVIESRRRHGSFVLGAGRRRPGAGGANGLDDAARAFAIAAHQLGATPHQALDAARRAHGDVRLTG